MEYKILVADDDKEIREAIEIYLTNEQMKSSLQPVHMDKKL